MDAEDTAQARCAVRCCHCWRLALDMARQTQCSWAHQLRMWQSSSGSRAALASSDSPWWALGGWHDLRVSFVSLYGWQLQCGAVVLQALAQAAQHLVWPPSITSGLGYLGGGALHLYMCWLGSWVLVAENAPARVWCQWQVCLRASSPCGDLCWLGSGFMLGAACEGPSQQWRTAAAAAGCLHRAWGCSAYRGAQSPSVELAAEEACKKSCCTCVVPACRRDLLLEPPPARLQHWPRWSWCISNMSGATPKKCWPGLGAFRQVQRLPRRLCCVCV